MVTLGVAPEGVVTLGVALEGVVTLGKGRHKGCVSCLIRSHISIAYCLHGAYHALKFIVPLLELFRSVEGVIV